MTVPSALQCNYKALSNENETGMHQLSVARSPRHFQPFVYSNTDTVLIRLTQTQTLRVIEAILRRSGTRP